MPRNADWQRTKAEVAASAGQAGWNLKRPKTPPIVFGVNRKRDVAAMSDAEIDALLEEEAED